MRHDRVVEERDPEDLDAFLRVPLDGDPVGLEWGLEC